MPWPVLMTAADGWAVAIAALGAALFGLAAVRQHGAVQNTMAADARGLRHTLSSFWALVRQPTWLIGSAQAVVAGALHICALALAPITLVQPIGVLAVPVTVVAAAVKARRRPSRSQIFGSILSVVGVVLLTVLLLRPSAHSLVLPDWLGLAVTVAVTTLAAVLAIVLRSERHPLLRCVTLAVTAAMLFGLNSILIRTIGHVITTNAASAEPAVLVTAVVGIAVALPVGLWAMQTAYVSGSPHVVICCLTLMDPIAAVAGGILLLHDGLVMTPLAIIAGIGCAVTAAVGVLFLSRDYPAEVGDVTAQDAAERPLTPAR